ncbi:MAG: tRNA (adenosine(37)-N6)-threonylcarbamoyltransferase complex ATPase subunit type 1 TsaE [Elusimicrobia bacterium]|nr:tRNA (adenosine(37)-N6)-threonylcarbamoyltransferase complex ATPase subunit type 1 TsaE [Elusimicrobiota bacterium]
MHSTRNQGPGTKNQIFISKSEEQTRRIGKALAQQLKPPSVLCLYGPMGSGKTTLVQGIARGMGFHGRAVSPTFNLVREYRTWKKTLYHLDLFRVASGELYQLGLEDYFSDPKGICVIEWAECARAWLPQDRLEIYLAVQQNGLRKLKFRAGRIHSKKICAILI